MSNRVLAGRRVRRLPAGRLPLLLGIILMDGCSAPQESLAPPRPVRVFTVGQTAARTPASFSGEITPRRETTLAFRIGGKLVARLVEVGDRARRGQPIARLDAGDFRLATQNLRAQLATAKAERDFAHADLVRYRELLEQNIIALPEFDRHQLAHTAAAERVAGLKAQLAQTINQLRYTELTAERDGVVTAFAAEAGDVLAAGQPVARVAQLDEKDVTVSIPEHRIAEISPGLQVQATLWSQGERRYPARIREIAPVADPGTRTYRVKAALLEGRELARLGMTATVWLPARAAAALPVPRSAVFTPHGEPQQPKVWLVDAGTGTVKSAPVTLGLPLDDERIEVSGIVPGQIIVSAGAQRLIEGQVVRLLAAAGSHRGQP